MTKSQKRKKVKIKEIKYNTNSKFNTKKVNNMSNVKVLGKLLHSSIKSTSLVTSSALYDGTLYLDAIFAIFSDNVTGNDNSFSNAPIKPHSFSVTVINSDFQLEQFEMIVSDSCMFSKNGSCVVTGEILCGCICKNDVVGIIDSDNEEMQRLKVLAIEINGKTVDKAERGTRCGLLLNGGADKKMVGKKIVKR